jgi:hypothetical protein
VLTAQNVNLSLNSADACNAAVLKRRSSPASEDPLKRAGELEAVTT